jgi:outer membrane protein OmpA-like peptidoglycan-associated protein
MRMLKHYLPVIFSMLFALQTSAQKFSFNATACDPTTTKTAVKYFKQSEKAGDGEEKREFLNKAIGAEPNYYEAHFELGVRYYKQKRYALSKDHFEQVKSICPKYSPYTYYLLGVIYYAEDDWKNALTNWKKFLEFEDIDNNDIYNAVKEAVPDLEAYVELITVPVPFNPTPVLGVCTDRDEYLGSLSPDNRNFYYIRKTWIQPKGQGGMVPEPYFAELFTVSQNNNNHFDGGTVMDKPFNDRFNNGAAAITADNKHMFFVICDNNQVEYCDIYYSEFKNGKWTLPANMGSSINSPQWDSQPTISYDGKTLIFSSMRTGGQGGADLWMSTKNEKGQWSSPTNLGNVINTPQHELTPFIHSDSQTLYFASKGHRGLGGYDLFFSKKDSLGNWTKPKNMGFPINSEYDESSFFVSLDGKKGFYSSDRTDEKFPGKGLGGIDIYSFDLYKEARPEEVVFIEGTVRKDDNTPIKGGEIEIVDMVTNEVTKVEVDSTDGKYVAVITNTNKHDKLLTLNGTGVAFTSTVIKGDAKTGEPLMMNLETKDIEVGAEYKLNDINFGSNSAELNDKTKFIIQQFSKFLKKNPKMKISINGHTDDVGDDDANLLLSSNRAKAVYDYLVSLGIPESNMAHQGFGEKKPVSSNSSEFGRAKNRRTEFVITAK